MNSCNYNIGQVAISYAQLCGVLGGFAFAAFTTIMSKEQTSSQRAFVSRRLAEILALAFFGFLGAAVLQTIRGGVLGDEMADICSSVLALTLLVDSIMVISVLLIIAGFIMMTTNFITLSKDAKQSMTFLYFAATIVSLFLIYITARDFWNSLPNPDIQKQRTIIVQGLELLFSFVLLLFPKKARPSFKVTVIALTSLITIGCVVSGALWHFRLETSYMRDNALGLYFGTLVLTPSLALIAKILYCHASTYIESDVELLQGMFTPEHKYPRPTRKKNQSFLRP